MTESIVQQDPSAARAHEAAHRLDWLVETVGISKSFGGTHALRDVSVQIAAGTVHCLVGENGAGKSTLGKIIAGVHAHDTGDLLVKGREQRYRSPHEALKAGTTIIAQELALLPDRTAAENVFLGLEPRRGSIIRTAELRRRYEELTERTGLHIPGSALVKDLRPGQQMEVEILRSLARDVDLIVMDEPTAALTSEEADKIFEVIRSLRRAGTTIVYVSHRLPEILDLADAISIFKDGQHVRTSRGRGAETEATLIASMLGRSLDQIFPPKKLPSSDAPVVLSVRGLARPPVVNDVSFEIRAGEIVGVAGLVGAGRSETARLIAGADRLQSGRIEVDGQELLPKRPRDSIRRGVVMLPESRKTQGLVMGSSVKDNTTVAYLGDLALAGVVNVRKERTVTQKLVDLFDVRAAGQGIAVEDLSGGNQQKVALAKWLLHQPNVLIVDEPTHGVDIGAKTKIYEVLADLAASGCAIMLISSELPEVLGLAHRVLVMANGRLVAEFGPGCTEDEVLEAAFHTDPSTPPSALSLNEAS